MKGINLTLIALFLAVIFIFSAAFVVVPDIKFSEQENRNLKTFPKASLEKIADGTYTAEMNEYFADQFVLRDTLVGLKGYAEALLCKGENNGVLLGKDGQLAVRFFSAYKSRLEKTNDTDFYYESNVKNAVQNLNKYAENEERPVITVLPPRTVDVAVSAFKFPDTSGEKLNECITSELKEKCGFIDLLPLFQEKYKAGEYVYYKTDHHWTSKGAYLAYCEILKKWGMAEKIIPEEAFKKEQIKDFYGTTWSKAGFKFIKPDFLEIWSVGNENEFETTCFTSVIKRDENNQMKSVKEAYKSFSGWINRDYLSQKNKYAAFLDGTHNEQTVFKKDSDKRERLLIAKDSFADTLVPFLSQHFDLVIINLSNGITDLSNYAKEYDCDRVLIVYNFENIISTGNLANIK